MLVSCSEDYDDDIKNLQSQIDGLATADELNSRINEMSSAIEQAKNEAIEKANAANEVALAAQQAAANAANTAEGAQQVADAAMAKAEELEKNGATKAEVEAAQQAAAAAQAFAEQAKADADKALADLQAALDAAVTAAQDAVTKAQATADEAKTTAEDAKAAAEKAFEDAKALIEKAEENAAEQAGEAMTKATEALDKALEAQSTAEQGVADAATALAAANAAAGDAQKAQEAAETAQKAADAAQATADEAKKLANDALSKISDLESKLNTAISNGATKEELTNAINDAKSTLNKAIEDAEKRATAAAQTAEAAAKAAQATADEALSLAKAATASISTIESQINNEKTGLAALDARLSTIEAWMKGGEAEGLVVDLKAVEEKLDSIDGALKEIVGEYSTMVTSVSFYYTDGLQASDLDFKFSKVTQKGNTFPKADVADSKLTFVDGYTTTDDISVVVRVSPTNATLTKENISLINSQGVELSDLVECSAVERYNDLLTRAAEGNGLWKLTFKFKDGADPAKFKEAVESDGKSVLFAVAVNNTKLNEDTRRVVTSYDMTLTAEDAEYADNTFMLKDNAGKWQSVEDIHNRYTASENGASTANVAELVWNDDTKPSTSATATNSSNRGRNGFDNRQGKDLLAAELGKAIEIKVDYDAVNEKVDHKIAGFYVTLDDKFAVNSATELKEWESYQYEGVGTSKQKATLFKGNEGKITIKSLDDKVAGDVIGFRLYAVNLDGTLLDPDGRAFYVVVGNAVSTADIAPATVKAEVNLSDFVEVPAGTFINCTSIDAWANVSGAKVDNYSNVFKVTYYAADKTTVIADGDYANYGLIRYVRFSMPDPMNFEDGGTYTQKLNLYTTVGEGSAATQVLTKTITATMTKVMPTAFLGDFGIKIGQNYENDYTVRPFMQPAAGWVVAASDATSGQANLSDIFTGLDNNLNYKFDFSGIGTVQADNDGDYILTASKSVIDDKVRDLKVYYSYRNISAVKQSNGTWKRGDLEIPYEKDLKARISTWLFDMDYAWNASVNKDLIWASTKTVKDINLSDVGVTNKRDDNTFGGSLQTLVGNKEYLEYIDGTAKLVVGDEENPYFDVEVKETSNGSGVYVFHFEQNTTDPAQAPYSNHTETLTFKVKDVYGIEKTIELDVNVKKPE